MNGVHMHTPFKHRLPPASAPSAPCQRGPDNNSIHKYTAGEIHIRRVKRALALPRTCKHIENAQEKRARLCYFMTLLGKMEWIHNTAQP